jgi:hypothetical protein
MSEFSVPSDVSPDWRLCLSAPAAARAQRRPAWERGGGRWAPPGVSGGDTGTAESGEGGEPPGIGLIRPGAAAFMKGSGVVKG